MNNKIVLYYIISILLLFLLAGCHPLKETMIEYKEVPIEKRVLQYQKEIVHDSVYIKQYQKGDTVYLDKFKYLYINKTDTVIDSIPYPMYIRQTKTITKEKSYPLWSYIVVGIALVIIMLEVKKKLKK